jgi:hypothetical protein
MQTAQDVEAFGNSMLQQGKYYNGEVQGLVDSNGRWKAIDFQAVRNLPPQSDTAAYNSAVERHNGHIQHEAGIYKNLAQQNAAAGTKSP